MKNKFYTFSLLLFCLLSQNSVQAQRHENVLKLGLIEPFYSSFGISYEKFIPKTDFSVQANSSITQRKITIWDNLTAKMFGWSTEIQGRYYFKVNKKRFPHGIYNGLFTKYAQYKITMPVPEGTVNFLDGNSKFLGFFMGYQHGFSNHFFVDATFGGGYHKADYSGRFSDKGRVIPSLISSGFLPKVDLKMGIAF